MGQGGKIRPFQSGLSQSIINGFKQFYIFVNGTEWFVDIGLGEDTSFKTLVKWPGVRAGHPD